jgi:hypothetical protein
LIIINGLRENISEVNLKEFENVEKDMVANSDFYKYETPTYSNSGEKYVVVKNVADTDEETDKKPSYLYTFLMKIGISDTNIISVLNRLEKSQSQSDLYKKTVIELLEELINKKGIISPVSNSYYNNLRLGVGVLTGALGMTGLQNKSGIYNYFAPQLQQIGKIGSYFPESFAQIAARKAAEEAAIIAAQEEALKRL